MRDALIMQIHLHAFNVRKDILIPLMSLALALRVMFPVKLVSALSQINAFHAMMVLF